MEYPLSIATGPIATGTDSAATQASQQKIETCFKIRMNLLEQRLLAKNDSINPIQQEFPTLLSKRIETTFQIRINWPEQRLMAYCKDDGKSGNYASKLFFV